MIESRGAGGLAHNPHGQELANVSIIMCAFAGAVFLCRMFTRIVYQKSVGWDDYTLVLSMALAIGITVCFNEEVYYGMGLHTKQVHDKHYKVMAFTWLWAAQLLYKFANGTTKISIVLLYMRIFTDKKFKIISFVFIGYVTAYCLAAILISIFQCDPVQKAWHKTLPGHCIDIGILWYTNSACTLLADVILIGMPINKIMRLKLPIGQKLGLVFVFSLGFFVMACTIIRCVMLGPTTSKKDPMYYQATSNSWTFLEVDVSIICASLPVLKAPLQHLLPRLFAPLRPSTYRATHKGTRASIETHHEGGWALTPGHGDLHTTQRCEFDDREKLSDEETILGTHDIRKTTSFTISHGEAAPSEKSREKEIDVWDSAVP